MAGKKAKKKKDELIKEAIPEEDREKGNPLKSVREKTTTLRERIAKERAEQRAEKEARAKARRKKARPPPKKAPTKKKPPAKMPDAKPEKPPKEGPAVRTSRVFDEIEKTDPSSGEKFYDVVEDRRYLTKQEKAGKYMYDPSVKGYVEYHPDKEITITDAETGETKKLTMQEVRGLYRRVRGNRYIKERKTGREIMTRKQVDAYQKKFGSKRVEADEKKRTIIKKPRMQLKVIVRYTYKGQKRAIEGFSHVSGGTLSRTEAIAEARSMARARIYERHNMTNSDQFRDEIQFLDDEMTVEYVEYFTEGGADVS